MHLTLYLCLQNYDKKIDSPRKSLLPQPSAKTSMAKMTNGMRWQKQKNQKQLLMIQPPPIEDIYLCDNCDAELTGYEQMRVGLM